jgi:Ca-activated chloride channel family protein
VTVAACAAGEGQLAAPALFARQAVEALELRRVAGAEPREIDWAIERLGIDFQIATRLTTWIAVSTEATVDPSAPTRREIVPQELPHGVSAEGLGLRPVAAPTRMRSAGPAMVSMPMAMSPAGMAAPPAPPAPPSMMKKEASPLSRVFDGVVGKVTDLMREIAEADDEASESESKPPAENVRPTKFRHLPGPPPPPEVEEKLKRTLVAEEPKPPLPGAPVRQLHFKLRLLKGAEAVLEVTVEDRDAVWTAPGTATVQLDDGTKVEAALDVTRSTRAGTYAPGQVLRIVITLAEAPKLKIFGRNRPRLVDFGTIVLVVDER